MLTHLDPQDGKNGKPQNTVNCVFVPSAVTRWPVVVVVVVVVLVVLVVLVLVVPCVGVGNSYSLARSLSLSAGVGGYLFLFDFWPIENISLFRLQIAGIFVVCIYRWHCREFWSWCDSATAQKIKQLQTLIRRKYARFGPTYPNFQTYFGGIMIFMITCQKLTKPLCGKRTSGKGKNKLVELIAHKTICTTKIQVWFYTCIIQDFRLLTVSLNSAWGIWPHGSICSLSLPWPSDSEIGRAIRFLRFTIPPDSFYHFLFSSNTLQVPVSLDFCMQMGQSATMSGFFLSSPIIGSIAGGLSCVFATFFHFNRLPIRFVCSANCERTNSSCFGCLRPFHDQGQNQQG